MSQISSHRQLLDLGAEVELLKLDLTPIGVSAVYYFCNDFGVVFAGQAYEQVPFEITEVERNVTGETIAPRISLPNTTKFASSLVVEHRDAVGAELTRTKTFQRFLEQWLVSPAPTVNANVTVTAQGNDFYRIQKTGGVNGNYDAAAYGPQAFTGDFTIQIKVPAVGTGVMFVAANSDPLTDNSYASLDYAYAYVTPNTWVIYSGGSQLFSGLSSAPLYAWIWRISGTLYMGRGNTLAQAQAAPDYSVANSNTMFLDSSGRDTNAYLDVYATYRDQGDPSGILSQDVFVIEQKVGLNKIFAQWELRALADTGDRKVPGRQAMKEICPYAYRTYDGAAFVTPKLKPCPYNHPSIFRTIDNAVTTDPAQDACDHKVDGGCLARASGWPSGILGFGGFPGMSRYRVG